MKPSDTIAEIGKDPFNPFWVITRLCSRGRKARYGAFLGEEVTVGRGIVMDPDCVHGFTKGILKVTPFMVVSIAVYITD